MKKSRKLLLAIPFLIMLGTCILVNRPLNVQKARAEEPISAEVVVSEEPTSELETVSESDFVINVDEEVSKISRGARDFIECVRAIFNQPIVIGGVSFTLGTLLFFVIGKVFGNYLSKRSNKWDKQIAKLSNKLEELLAQVGINAEIIEYLKGIIKEIIENTKNIQVREDLEKKYKQLENIGKTESEKAKEIVREIVGDLKGHAADTKVEIDETQEKVKDLFK